MKNIIEVQGLQKSYGDIKAVKGIDFAVKKGDLFAFLGVNGAGKSTTINMLCTLLPPDGGRAEVCGYDLVKDAEHIRQKIGVVFQGSVLDKRLTVYENLAIRAAYYGILGNKRKQRLEELDGILGLKDLFPRQYGKLSGGQRRRVDLARGLINMPELLFLDEPTTGLDPQTRKIVWLTVDSLRKNGLTVFLTTHYMEEADGADEVVIIDDGLISARGTPVDLKNTFGFDYLNIYSQRDPALELALEGKRYSYESGVYKMIVSSSAEAKAFITRYSDLIADFEVIKGNMDDVFLNVTGKKLLNE